MVLVIVALLTSTAWLPFVGRFLVVSDPLPAREAPADAVVPLAGGDERIRYAAELFRSGYAGWLVATDMPLHVPGVRSSYAELVRQEAIWQGVPAERIIMVPHVVETTCQEARAVIELALEQGWDSLLVVTDPCHTRRAHLCFRDASRGTGATVAVRAIEGSRYDPDAWWLTIDSIRETWTEYTKLVLHAVGYR